MTDIKLSIVATLYNSAAYINEFCRRSTAAALELAGDDYEIILVDDGSPDNGLQIAIEIAKADEHVVVVELSRNFGHYKAMMTGLAHAKAENVFLIDSDLEEEPEWLLPFARQMEQEHCDVVFGVQENRKGGFFERLSGQWFYTLFNLLTGMQLPRNLVTARLMTRKYVDALLLHREREVFIAGIWHITGFRQSQHVIRKHSSSETTYTFAKKMSLVVNAVTSFSNKPLVMIFYCGLAISLLALCYIAYLVGNWFFWAKPLTGWTSIMASIWLLGGMIISFIGVVGIYLSRIFSETKQRPYTIVREIHGKTQS